MTLDDLRDRGITRRCALLGAGGVGAAAVLAACSSGSTGGGDAAGTSSAASTAPSAAGTAAASTPASSAASSSAAPAGGGEVIAALADVPVGGTASAQVDGETVLLSQPTAGTVDAFSSVCPHQGGNVKPDGGKFQCSLHFSEFALDGAVTKGPAVKDLTPVSVAVSGTNIVKA